MEEITMDEGRATFIQTPDGCNDRTDLVEATESKGSKTELLRGYPIEIKFLSGRGCVVRVGCKEIAFTTNEDAMKAVNEYVEDPHKYIDYWNGEFSK